MQGPAGHGQHLRVAASPTPTVPPQAACRAVPGGLWGLLGLGGRCSLCSGPSMGPSVGAGTGLAGTPCPQGSGHSLQQAQGQAHPGALPGPTGEGAT